MLESLREKSQIQLICLGFRLLDFPESPLGSLDMVNLSRGKVLYYGLSFLGAFLGFAKVSVYSYVFTSPIFLGYIKYTSLSLTLSLFVGVGLREACDYSFSLRDSLAAKRHSVGIVLSSIVSSLIRSVVVVPLILFALEPYLAPFQGCDSTQKLLLYIAIILFSLSNLLSPLIASHSRSPRGSLLFQPVFSISRTLIPVFFFVFLPLISSFGSLSTVSVIMCIEAVCTILIFIYYFKTEILVLFAGHTSLLRVSILFKRLRTRNAFVSIYPFNSGYFLGASSLLQALPGYFDKYIVATFSNDSFALSYISLSLVSSLPVVFYNIRVQPLMALQSEIAGLTNSLLTVEEFCRLESLRIREVKEARAAFVYVLIALVALVGISRTGLLSHLISSTPSIEPLQLFLIASSFLFQAYACVVCYQFVLYQKPIAAFLYSALFSSLFVAVYAWSSSRHSLACLSVLLFVVALAQFFLGLALKNRVIPCAPQG